MRNYKYLQKINKLNKEMDMRALKVSLVEWTHQNVQHNNINILKDKSFSIIVRHISPRERTYATH